MKFKAVAIYVRVSTGMQAEGYSIDEQVDRLKKYCELQDWVIYNTYTDAGFTGSNINRPGMDNLVKDVEMGKIDLVLVYKLDRLSRSQKDTLYLIEEKFLPNKVDFISLTENFDTSSPFGRAMIGILSVFAQLERENIKSRMAMGRLGRVKAGYWRAGSNIPIGYDYKDGMLIPNEYEAMQVRIIFERFLEGESIRSISKYMNENYTNKYSNYSNSGHVGVMLKNVLYIGKVKYKDEIYDGAHEAIVDIDIFNRAQERYKELSNKYEYRYRSPFKSKHLLTGLLFCGNCGARYFVISKRLKSGRYEYYKCYTRDGNSSMKTQDYCKNPTIKKEILDNLVLNEIKKLKLDENYLESLIKTETKKLQPKSDLSILYSKVEELDLKINKLMDLYTLGTIEISQINDKIKPIYEEKNKIEKQIEIIKSENKNDKKSIKEIRDILKVVDEDLDKLDPYQKRELVQSLIKKVVVLPGEDNYQIYWKFL